MPAGPMQFKLDQCPKISVIMPSLNQCGYLREALQSVVDQRYPALELIVMDGGSTDGSMEVIRSFEEHVAYWESREDRGQSHAINKGFAKATGEVLCWLNSDDVLLPGALNAVTYAFEANPGWHWLSAPSLRFGERLHRLDGISFLPRSRVEWLLRCPLSQPSTFWKRSLFEQHGGLDESYHFALDYEYWTRFVFAGETVHLLKRPLSAFRLHDTSKTVSQSEKFRLEEVRLREKYGPKLTSSEAAHLKRALAGMAGVDELTAAVVMLEKGKVSEARARVMLTLRKRPGLLFTRIGAGSLSRVIMNRRRYS